MRAREACMPPSGRQAPPDSLGARLPCAQPAKKAPPRAPCSAPFFFAPKALPFGIAFCAKPLSAEGASLWIARPPRSGSQAPEAPLLKRALHLWHAPSPARQMGLDGEEAQIAAQSACREPGRLKSFALRGRGKHAGTGAGCARKARRPPRRTSQGAPGCAHPAPREIMRCAQNALPHALPPG